MAGTTTSITVTSAQQRFMSWASDVLVYIVVLNLFVEFNDAIVIDSFWISILTAVLLKALLDVVVGIEHRVKKFFVSKGSTPWRIIGLIATFAILFTSKLLILEIVNFVFGEHVELGHFLDVLLLIIGMMAARSIVGRFYQKLGDTGASE